MVNKENGGVWHEELLLSAESHRPQVDSFIQRTVLGRTLKSDLGQWFSSCRVCTGL